MWTKILPLTIVLALVRAPSPLASNPAFDTYQDIFIRGTKGPGFWGAVGPQTANVFDSQWNGNGYHEMYNLNSNSPMAGSRGTGFDATTTMFNQYGPTNFEVIPVQSNFMPQSRLNAYTYDLNEPRMAQIYKNYLRFMNKNLDRLGNVLKDNTNFSDLNENDHRKLKNPAAFQYKNSYFDGLNADSTLPTYYHQPLTWVPQPLVMSGSERRLMQRKAPAARPNSLQRVKSLKKSLNHIEQKLKSLEDAVLSPQKPHRNQKRYLAV